MKIHFIAIGGAVMHNLAIALHKKGYKVSGSDDEIFDPSRSRLEKYGILPEEWGWFPDKIRRGLDAIILGMHARENNPELVRARELGLKIYSFPEYLYEQTKHKKRIVIAGSHGKTTVTSMVMHALKRKGIPFDYMVGSQLEGFETMVGLEESTNLAIFEGDEYLSSPLDPRPKFIHYKPHITLITGISWDHINVYPDYNEYKKQFQQLALITQKKGEIIYYENDRELKTLLRDPRITSSLNSYSCLEYKTGVSETLIQHENRWYTTRLLGRYNLENLTGAMKVCHLIGIPNSEFLSLMSDFKGAARRQECIFKNEKIQVYLDFAHAPSKVRATVSGFRESFPDKKLAIILELHTFSSLNSEFIPLYRSSLDSADESFVFFSPEVVKHKNLPALDTGFIKKSFDKEGLQVLTDSGKLEKVLRFLRNSEEKIILIMSSGNLGGIDLKQIFSN